MTKTEIDLLILDYMNGVLSLEKEKKLTEWIASSPQNTSHFTKTVAYWELTTTLKTSKKYNPEKAWKKLIYRINPKVRYMKAIRNYGKIAVIFLFAFISSFYFYQFIVFDRQEIKAAMIINEVPLGSRSQVTLPDGSKVWINAGSKLTYHTDFDRENRELKLEGEAYFDVTTNKCRPFLVEAHGLKVKATGTRFNVRAYHDEDFIETTLVEGKVSINRFEKDKSDEVILAPNQKLTVYKAISETTRQQGEKLSNYHKDEKINPSPLAIKKVELVSNIETRIYTSWKDEEWIIKKEELGSLAEKLERRYDAKLIFIDEFIKKYSYSGTLRDETLEQVLHVISQTSPIQYKLDKKNVTIWHKPKS